MKGGEFFNEMSDCQFLKENSGPWNSLLRKKN
jgi:hypothetical protein